MGAVGQVTKSTDLWMSPADERQFGAKLSGVFPQAKWRCSQPGLDTASDVHLHTTIEEAMECGGTQAMLPIPVGADPTRGESKAIVRFLRSRATHQDSYPGAAFRHGNLGVRWNKASVDDDIAELLANRATQIWKVMRGVTRPARLQYLDGTSAPTGKRVGEDAGAKILEAEMVLAGNGLAVWRLLP